MASLWRLNLPLVTRMYVLTGVLIALIAIIGTGTVLLRQRAAAAETRLTEVLVPAEIATSGLSAAYSDQANGVHGFLLTRDPSLFSDYVGGRSAAARMQTIVSQQLGDDPLTMTRLAAVSDAAGVWHQQSVQPELDKIAKQQAISPAESSTERQRFVAVRDKLNDLENHIGDMSAAEAATAGQSRTFTDWLIAVTGLLGIMVVVGTIVVLRKYLTQPLRTLVSQVDNVAAGDLESPVKEVGPTELATVANAVERMRTRILSESRRAAQLQSDLARHEEGERRRKAEQDFATVVATLDEGVVVTSPAGVVESANPAAGRILGIPEHEITGSSAVSWTIVDANGADLGYESRPGVPTRRTGLPENQRVARLQRADGSTVWLSVTSRALAPEDDPPFTVVTSFNDVTESHAAQERLEHEATHDPLTGLANRTLVLRHLGRRETPQNREHPVAVLFIDLDNFKRINDSLGHGSGDEVLRTIGRRLTRVTADGDLVGRLGGDEFVVITQRETQGGALGEFAERLLTTLAEPIRLRERLLHLTGSVGIVVSHPGDDRTGEDLLRDADIAMYHAKEQGSGQHAFFDVALRERIQRHMLLEQDLRQALPRNEFWVAFQPIVDLRTSHTMGVESLLRWAHPGHGAISPAEFIPIAEESGLIHSLGTRMLNMATRQFADRMESGHLTQLNANLSPLQLEDPHLGSRIQHALARSGLPPHALCLEITEEALIRDPDAAARILHSLRELGVSLAIDDFGTGYSSLAQLRQLPLDVLKIDRSFIVDLSPCSEVEVMVTSIVAMAHALGLSVIAEGVETTTQLEVLRRIGCEQAQGYLFGRPTGLDDLSRPSSSGS